MFLVITYHKFTQFMKLNSKRNSWPDKNAFVKSFHLSFMKIGTLPKLTNNVTDQLLGDRATYKLWPPWPVLHVPQRCFDTLQVHFEVLHHGQGYFVDLVIVAVVPVIGKWIWKHGLSLVIFGDHFLKQRRFVLHEKVSPDSDWVNDFESLTGFDVLVFEASSLSESWIDIKVHLASLSKMDSIYWRLPSDWPRGWTPWM